MPNYAPNESNLPATFSPDFYSLFDLFNIIENRTCENCFKFNLESVEKRVYLEVEFLANQAPRKGEIVQLKNEHSFDDLIFIFTPKYCLENQEERNGSQRRCSESDATVATNVPRRNASLLRRWRYHWQDKFQINNSLINKL